MKAIYGYSQTGPFADVEPERAIEILLSWGADTVFGGYQDEAFVQTAHDAGMRVMAEFGCFVRQSWWTELPESRPIMGDGAPLPLLDWYAGVTPTVPQVRRGLLERLAELVDSTPVDGVWLDFIRWSSRWESPDPAVYETSFDPITLSQFGAHIGLPDLGEMPAPEAAALIRSHHCEAWTTWRCDRITDWVQQARRVIDESSTKPCTLGMFSVPWDSGERDRGLTRIMGQDLQALGQLVDVISPMVYHRMCGQPVEWIARIADHHRDLSGASVVPIIQTVNKPDALTNDELRRAIVAAQSAQGSEGVILFTLAGLVESDRLAELGIPLFL
jgi:hypothetical protein